MLVGEAGEMAGDKAAQGSAARGPRARDAPPQGPRLCQHWSITQRILRGRSDRGRAEEATVEQRTRSSRDSIR